MSIRQGILLLGAIAALSLAYLLAESAVRRTAAYRAQRIVAEELRLVPALSAIVHELQRERGLTSGYLGRPSREHLELMLAQRERTDEVLAGHPLSDAEVRRLHAELQAMRVQALDGNVSWTAPHAFYTREVERIVGRLAELTRTSPVVPEDLQALVHLVTAKEDLGQIRSLVNRSLQDWKNVDVETSYAAARLETRVRSRLDLFRGNASSEALAVFDRVVAGDAVREALELVSLIASPRYREVNVEGDSWFDLVSPPIDGIRKVERTVLETVARNVDDLMRAVRSGLARDIVLIMGIGLLVFGLVVYTMRKVLHALDALTASIDKVVESRDFSTRIRVSAQGEAGIIVRGFNKLLDAAEGLLKEKHRLAYTDALTGIPNRLYFNEVAHNALARRQRHPGSLSLIILDIDHFKKVNDTFGHDVGDDVLREFSARIQGAIRSIDLFARWGGEEFVILLPDDGPEAAALLAEKLRLMVESEPFAGAGRITSSFGVAGLLPDEEFDGLCKRADQALYESKHQGRNRVTVA
ncbi:diguanylate cyclase (GGDEF) domain-containing protein [Desulfonatronum zhilinae]|nr:diguanylate cyclase (GGDEF) domain-containing protein [Desulfonatronum zhilinae]